MSDLKLGSELLGFEPGSCLLIINADDFGMCHAVNMAVIDSIKHGLASSCTIMIPCPWSPHALQLLQENRQIPFGVHLTAISEHQGYRWRPVSSSNKVPTLLDERGYFRRLDDIDALLANADLNEIEQEFRAQIESVLKAGLIPTHLDSHCHLHTRREDIFELTMILAREYGLALRVHTRSITERIRQYGLPGNDHDVMDGYHIQETHQFKLQDKIEQYCELLRELPPGLNEWAIHPALKTEELMAMEPETWEVRVKDYEFLKSERAKRIIVERGIVVMNYHPLQTHWNKMSHIPMERETTWAPM